MGHRGIVDFEDAEGLRIVHPHGVRVGREEQAVMLHGQPRSQELILQQGQDHAESHEILGHVPQPGVNLRSRSQIMAKQANGKHSSPSHQAQDGGHDPGRGTPEVEPVERGEGKENLKQKRQDALIRGMVREREDTPDSARHKGQGDDRPYPAAVAAQLPGQDDATGRGHRRRGIQRPGVGAIKDDVIDIEERWETEPERGQNPAGEAPKNHRGGEKEAQAGKKQRADAQAADQLLSQRGYSRDHQDGEMQQDQVPPGDPAA